MAIRTLITSTSLVAAVLLSACATAARPASGASSRACAAGAADSAVGPAYARAELDVPAAPIGRMPAPQTPQVLLEVWQPQVARVAFVIDTLGCAERGSGRLLHATHPAWGEASLRVLPRLRFTPAQKGGRPVRQRSDMEFAFEPSGG